MKKTIYILLILCGMPLLASAQDLFGTTDNPFGGDLSSVTISSSQSFRSPSNYRVATRNSSSATSATQSSSFLNGLFSSSRRNSGSSSNNNYFSTGSALESYSLTSRVNSRQFGSNTSSYVPFESDISSVTRSSRPAKIPGGDPIGGFVPLTDSIWLVALLVAAYVFIIYRRQQKSVKK